MYCGDCRSERGGTARFCVLCGGSLTVRPLADVEAELAHVRWLLGEVARWESPTVPERARVYLDDRYRRSEAVLLETLRARGSTAHLASTDAEGATPPSSDGRAARGSAPGEDEAAFATDSTTSPPPSDAEAGFGAAATDSAAPPAAAASPPKPAAPAAPPDDIPSAVLDVPPPRPTREARTVQAASTWNRFWKPFLTESVGWFIGAFLILSGTLYLVADAWDGMASTTRALTVFGLAAGWTLTFAAWARFLSRRETTQQAARVLRLIAAAIAPLATIAAGPMASAPWLFWPVVLGWSAVAGFLAWRVAHAEDVAGEQPLAVAWFATTLVMGAAPLAAALGPSVVWLNVLPIGLAALSWRGGPRAAPLATRFALLAMLFATALFAARLHLGLAQAGTPVSLALYAPLLSGLVACALWLRSPTRRAADVLSVSAVALQGVLLAPAAVAAPPALFFSAALAAWSSAKLALERRSKASARWLYPAYAFAYVAFQRVDQLVPGPAAKLFAQVKLSLGYSVAPLPPSYGSIYAALFVAVVGLLAARAFGTKDETAKEEAHVLLRATAVASVVFGALALVSLQTDARPALVATPLLAALGLGIGLWRDRRDLLVSGTLTALGAALAYAAKFGVAWPMGAGALVLAALSVRAARQHREVLTAGAALLVALTAGLAWRSAPAPEQVLALALASAAFALVVRTLEQPTLHAAVWVGPFLVVARAGLVFAPAWGPLALAVTALAGALVSRRDGTWRALWPASALAALAAPPWVLLHLHLLGPWPGLVWATAAAALLVGARRAAPAWSPVAQLVGLLFALVALLPTRQTWPWMTPEVSSVSALLLALGAGVVAVRRGRSWQGAVLASGALLVALSALAVGGFGDGLAALAAATAAAATPALLASVTVPLAAVLVMPALSRVPGGLMGEAVVLSAVALLEEWDTSWRLVLNRARVAWAASAAALVALLVALAVGRAEAAPALLLPAALLPLLWMRATRHALPGAVGLLLLALVSALAGGAWHFLPPVVLVLLSRVVDASPSARRWLGCGEDHRVPMHLLLAALFAAAGVALHTSSMHLGPEPVLAWAAALVLMAGPMLALRLAAAAALSFFAPELASPVAVSLVAFALAAHHRPEATARLFGARDVTWAPAAAVLSAVVVAGVQAVTVGGLGPQVVLAVSLGTAALLLPAPPLLSLAVVALGVDLHGAVWRGEWMLPPSAVWVAGAAAALAALLRGEAMAQSAEEAWAKLGRETKAPASRWLWVGAALLVGSALPAPGGWWLVPAAVLLVTPRGWEAVAGVGLLAATVVVNVEAPVAAVVLAALGASLAWAGVVAERRHEVARVWHHVGWVVALLSLGLATSLNHVATPVAWALAAAAGVAVAVRRPAAEWVGWVSVLAALHVALAHAGLVLATGAPQELILPWMGLASALVAATALGFSRSKQQRGVALSVGLLALVELLGASMLLAAPHAREGLVVALAAGLLVWFAGRAALREDDSALGVLAQVAAAVGLLAVRRVGFAAGPDAFEAWAALAASAALGGLARLTAASGHAAVAKTMRVGAQAWPLLGLAVAPWETPLVLSVLLLAQAAHYALAATDAASRKSGSLLATVAFNAAMVAAWLGAGWSAPEYLALPAGLSLLLLVRVFQRDLGRAATARLRAVAVTAMYAAAAWRPLAFDAPWALFLCVGLCVVGVAAGVALRVRSFVYLGTGFLVTTVLATLIRSGIREPRLGALFLSGLGLLVVGFMVVVSTRRAELLASLKSVRRELSTWGG